jgi:hypothetical protein
MKERTPISRGPSPDPVYLAAAAVSSLIETLPSGTAFFIGIVLIVMMTGRLVQTNGSLARAVLPLVVHLRWGWHRVERAMERGKVWLDALFDRAFVWCLANLPVGPARLGCQQREVLAIDSSTIARWRSGARLALAGQGYCHRAGRAVRADIVAAVTSVVLIWGVRVGLVRRIRFGASSQEAVDHVFRDLPPSARPRLIGVDAGIATQDRFAAATDADALLGRLRINCQLRCAPPPPERPARGHPVWHGPVLHPGAAQPEVEPSEEFIRPGPKGDVRVRRWNELHFQESRQTLIDVLRIDDPTFERPLVVGTTARELTTEEFLPAYPHRWPVETNFFVAQDTTAMERPRAWTEKAVERRIGLSLLTGSLLKAIAAVTGPLAMGPWDRQPMPSAGRLANYLDTHLTNFSALALNRVQPRNYRVIPETPHINDLPQPKAA